MVVLRSLVCLVIIPALFFGMIKLAELTGTIAQATFVGSTMPPATLSFMFAQQHATYETESVAHVGHIDRSVERQVELNRVGHFNEGCSDRDESSIATSACSAKESCGASVLTPRRKSSNGVLSPRPIFRNEPFASIDSMPANGPSHMAIAAARTNSTTADGSTGSSTS